MKAKTRGRGEAAALPNAAPNADARAALARVRDLGWSGQHERAIAISTQELARCADADATAALRMDLLDLRSESHIAVGQLDLAAADASAMVKLAPAVGEVIDDVGGTTSIDAVDRISAAWSVSG